ncbi:MAG TPA: Fur family transcriptional regulator [Gammaproteobacteria bacterium]|nr:Fur family transcriptional regulator [Gammaproteobacteria bacterium]
MNREEIAHFLDQHGVTPTQQRLDVGEVILAMPQHSSAEQIIAGIKAKGFSVSKATVYNTLNLFCERGLLRTVNIDPERQFYDPTVTPHHHLYNMDTGELMDIEPENVALEFRGSLPPGTERRGVDVVILIGAKGGER